jgi:hypothetical protein
MERGVGSLDQRFAVLPMHGIEGDAHARADLELFSREDERRSDRVDHPLRDEGDVLGGTQMRQEDHELVSPLAQHHALVGSGLETRGDVGASDASGEPLGDLDQHVVALIAPTGLVDPPEALEIDEEQGGQSAVSLALEQCLLDPLAKDATMGKAGQLVDRPASPRLGFAEPIPLDLGLELCSALPHALLELRVELEEGHRDVSRTGPHEATSPGEEIGDGRQRTRGSGAVLASGRDDSLHRPTSPS